MHDLEYHIVLEGVLGPLESLEARRRRRTRMEKLFEELGREHARDLRTPIDFTSGEVFQALVRRPDQVPPLLAALHHELHTDAHHLGLGWGRLSTPVSGRVRRMDGPAFDHASSARVEAEELGDWARAVGFGEAMDRILQGHLLLLVQVQDAWKPHQREPVELMRRMKTRKEVAHARGVQPSTVTRSLDGAFYDGVRALEDSLSLLLGALETKPPVPSSSRRKRP